MSEETPTQDITFKIKTSGDSSHTITISDAKTVKELKELLSGDDYEKIPAGSQRLIYSGRVLKDEEPLRTYKIKSGNTIHMVKSAQSNAAQKPPAGATPSVGSAPRSAAGVPTNMAAGTANNPLAGLTGARYAGRMGLPSMDTFGADFGMGAPQNEDEVARMMEDPNTQQMMTEAFNNPDVVEMMIQNVPGLRDNPQARQMLQSPEFRQMMTNPDMIRQAGRMRRAMGGGQNAFPAPGVTDSTPHDENNPDLPPLNPFGAQGQNPFAGMGGAPGQNPFAGMGGAPGQNPFAALADPNNPFASLFQPQGLGQTPTQTPPAPASVGQATPSSTSPPAANPANPFASLFGAGGAGGAGGANPFTGPGGMQITPEMMQQAQQMMANGGFNNMFGNQPGGAGGAGGANPFGSPASPPAPADTRPPEERYADQLRQLNDMGFTNFDRNVEALRRSGGSVQGAIENLLG